MLRHACLLPATLLLLGACATRDLEQHRATPLPLIDPAPATRTTETSEDYHGTTVSDPYRWLEDLDSPEVSTWTDAQNARTEQFLAQVPARTAIRQRLTELWSYERRSAPQRHGRYWAWFRNEGLQNHNVLLISDRPLQNGRVLLDPNLLSADGSVALSALSFTSDGSKLAYSLSKSGSDWQEWHVLDVASGAALPDLLQWSKFSGAAWTKDGKGFFYQRYPAPATGKVLQAINEKPQLCYHELGKPQSEDRVVFERPDEPQWGFDPSVSHDGRLLVISVWSGTDRRNRVMYVDLEQKDAEVRPLLMEFDAGYGFVEAVGTRLYFWTDFLAPRGRLIAFDVANPVRESWETIIPETKERLESVRLVGGKLFASSLRDAHSALRVHSLDGKLESELELPTLGSASTVTGRPDDDAAYFVFSSFTNPGTIFCYELKTKSLIPVWSASLAFDPAAFTTKQVFYQSKDGTRVPMFLVHQNGIKLHGDHPTYLTAYGGFGSSMTPAFSRKAIAWLELGGVYALACLRGGSEYGEQWHEAGMLAKKQNVFDDFCAAAEYLIRNGYTRSKKLAITGGSNGGLLVGACMTQRPELFGAAIPEVGVMDMLRFHKFTIGWAWSTEYGSSEDAKMFPVLYKYSPLHNVRAGVAYPATLIMTSDHDDRVLPAHSYKFAAALQNAAGVAAPVFLRVEKQAGHGVGLPTSKEIEGSADSLAFLMAALDIDPGA